MKKRVVGLGEVLWDHLPERTCLGGAPANFAYITTLMGDQGIVASRVGEDSRVGQIAATALGVPSGTVKSRCSRGRARLAVSLGHLRNRPLPPDVPPTSGTTTEGGAA